MDMPLQITLLIFICNIALISISEECNLQKSTSYIFTTFPFTVQPIWIQAISTWAFDWMDFISSMDSVIFTWPQKLFEMVEVWEDPGINGDVGAIPQQYKHSSICSKQRELFLLCVFRWLLGSDPLCSWGSFPVEIKKSIERRTSFSCDAEGGQGG